MVHSREQRGADPDRGRAWCLMGVRTVWRTLEDGAFYCPDCGGDRNYRRRTGRRRLTVLGVPLLDRGTVGPSVVCSSCQGRFDTDALDRPTTLRLAAMLRDAVHTITLAVLAAGGTQSRCARERAVETVRSAGFSDCTEDQLTALTAALCADTEDSQRADRGPGFGDEEPGAALEGELQEVLTPLAPHLAPAGRENLLLQGARIALADGLYLPAERDVLTAVGRHLQLGAEHTSRLLAAARTPS